MAHAADDDVTAVVAEERVDLLIGHVEGERLVRVKGRAVHEDQLAAVLEGNALVGRQSLDALEDEVPELRANRLHAVEHQALVLASGTESVRIEGRQSFVGHALDHHRAGGREAPPCLERLRSGKDDVTGDEQLVERALLGRRQDSAESVEVAVDVGDTEEKHREARIWSARPNQPQRWAFGL